MSAPAQQVFRFAPSPNGLLHLGHALSALLNFRLARAAQGRFLLRIEDIDPVRSRPEFVRAIEDDLTWLGLVWEKPVRHQSHHMADYARALDALALRGLLYPCFCTRGDLARAVAGRPGWPHDPDGAPLYPGTCRDMPQAARALLHAIGAPFAQRLDLAKALAALPLDMGWRETCADGSARSERANPALWGDAILARKDVPASYHLCVVVDDALQGVSDVVRGADLAASTHLHRLLQAVLSLPVPRYHHHSLIIDEAGAKLAKSRLSQPLRQWRAQGATPDDIARQVGL